MTSEIKFHGHDELDKFIKSNWDKCEPERMKLQLQNIWSYEIQSEFFLKWIIQSFLLDDFFSQLEMELWKGWDDFISFFWKFRLSK